MNEQKKDLKQFLLTADLQEIKEVEEYLHPVDILEALHRCSDEEAEIILGKLSDETVADVLDEEDDEDIYSFLKKLSIPRQNEVLEEMSSDERADFVRSLDEDESKDVMSRLTTEDKKEVTELLQYEPDTAGGLMAVEVITIYEVETSGGRPPVAHAVYSFRWTEQVDPSGIRLGTPSVTSRGFGTEEMKKIAAWMDAVVSHIDDEAFLAATAKDVAELCSKFSVPGIE